MSQVINNTISTIAESIGIPHIKDSIYAQLSSKVEHEILEMLSDALQIMVTCKRTRLCVSDINAALELNGMEPVFGYSNGMVPPMKNAGNVNALDLLIYNDHQIQIDNNKRFEAAAYPFDTYYEFGWMAIAGRPLRTESVDEQQASEQISEDLKVVTNQQKQKPDSDLEFASNKHVFSYELQLFYKKLRDFLIDGTPELREKMLKNLKTNRCIQTLLPYYLRFSFLLLHDYPHKFDMLYVAISTIRSLVANHSLRFFDVYMPHFISITLSCLLSPQIGPKLWNELFIIRSLAADLLRFLLKHSFEQGYSSVQPRITLQLLSVLLKSEYGISEKCGALQGLISMDLETTSKFVLPHIGDLINELGKKSMEGDLNYTQLRMHFYSLSVSAFGATLHADTYRLNALGIIPAQGYSKDLYHDMMDIFGDEALNYVVDDSSFLYL
ncbi:hypothetical protein M9Y10_012743 [Tritrichomonas musculus]|uniref:TATA box binding protein associated factor (TAF) histone-like fold domain-containing protein n=1 Tax=Tritrichomonas musculus TaxID=1915356 RepID=A0ABR2IDG4_9EUKA